MKLGRLFSFIGLAILVFMLSNIGPEKILVAVQSLDIRYMAGFFAILAATIVLKGLKWKATLNIFGIRAKPLVAVEMWIIGFFIGAVTPGRVGDFAKIFYLDEKKSKSLGAVLVDRVTDVFAVTLFALIGVGVFGSIVGITYEAVSLLGFIAIFTLLILKRHRKAVAEIFLGRLIPEKHRNLMRDEMGTFYHSLRSAAKNRIALLKVTAMAIVIWMISAVQGLFIAKSLSIDISYFLLLLMVSIVALIELIPITVAGLGTREASIVVMMSFLGIESSRAIVFSLVNFIFGYLALAALGYLVWLRNPIKINFKKEI